MKANPMCEKYLKSDFRSLDIHTLIADKIVHDPDLVINRAISNISRWKALNDTPQPYLDEWLEIINKGPEFLIEFLKSTSEDGQRLRSSSPFTGILSEQERLEIFNKYSDLPMDDIRR